jgi:hypothetical protein
MIRHWNGGDYESQPIRGLTGAIYALNFMSSSPLLAQKQAPTRDLADQVFDNYVKTQTASRDANDMLYQFDASRDYDPPLYWKRSRRHFLQSTPQMIRSTHLNWVSSRGKSSELSVGRCVVIPISERTQGHGSHSVPSLWKDISRAFWKLQSRKCAKTSAICLTSAYVLRKHTEEIKTVTISGKTLFIKGLILMLVVSMVPASPAVRPAPCEQHLFSAMCRIWSTSILRRVSFGRLLNDISPIETASGGHTPRISQQRCRHASSSSIWIG